MSDETGSILAREIKKAGGFLAGWVARMLPDNTGEVSLVIHASAEQVLAQAQALLGEPAESIAGVPPAEGCWTVFGIVGAGFAEMNPAVVTLEIRPTEDPARTEVLVRAVAKEGLIKQNTGETSANRLALDLAQACGPYTLQDL